MAVMGCAALVGGKWPYLVSEKALETGFMVKNHPQERAVFCGLIIFVWLRFEIF
jgi:hypothetical protein